MCEDCGLKSPSFGMEDERKMRWCSGCAKAHGAVNLVRQCEDCALKSPSFGMEDERKRRWCSGCVKAHEGAVALYKNNPCEDCGLKVPNYGLDSERKLRWCGDCAKAQGAVHHRKWQGAGKALLAERRKTPATKRRRGQSEC